MADTKPSPVLKTAPGASASLFSEMRLRSVSLRNRIVVSPMCQYSSHDGFANDWHRVHLGSRAVGGAALILTEASAVEASGRISAWDLGIWKDEHVDELSRIVDFIQQHGAVAGIQLAHAGRKASVRPPWEGGSQIPPTEECGWQPVAPSPIPFNPADALPHELTRGEIGGIIESFARAAERALRAGFRVVEVHAAHGYLAHQFLSPLSNRRTDDYGGSFQNRTRFLVELTTRVRAAWPAELPLWIRLSATDWVEGGWDLPQSIQLCHRLRELGVDVIDCSSGGAVPGARIPLGAGYQTPFAEAIRRSTWLATAAVGMITSAPQADHILRTGQADLIVMARALLRDPYWPLHAARELGASLAPPRQYDRAFPNP